MVMLSQIAAVFIFLAMFITIITNKVERYIPALIGGVLVILVVFLGLMHAPEAAIQTLNIHSIFTPEFWFPGPNASESSSGVNWTTIIFIAGMMYMVEGMAEAGFFRWLCMELAKLVRFQVMPLFLSFMVLSAVLAMFIDSITVILFLASISIELAHMLKFDPVPMIIAEIFTANLGGAATMSGDPPNIIVGTSLGFSFFDFLTNTGIIVLVSLVVVIAFFYVVCRKSFQTSHDQRSRDIQFVAPKIRIHDKFTFGASCVIFLLSVVLLVTHATTGLAVCTIGVIAAGLTAITSHKVALKLLKRLDWRTLLFFVGLFIVVGGMEQTGVLNIIATFIASVAQGHLVAVILIILWISAIASAFVDNIPFAATMVPVIQSLAATQGFDLETLAWALSLGTDVGGNGTPIGASANVVGSSVAAREGHPFGWGRYCKLAVPATLLTLVVCSLCLVIRYT